MSLIGEKAYRTCTRHAAALAALLSLSLTACPAEPETKAVGPAKFKLSAMIIDVLTDAGSAGERISGGRDCSLLLPDGSGQGLALSEAGGGGGPASRPSGTADQGKQTGDGAASGDKPAAPPAKKPSSPSASAGKGIGGIRVDWSDWANTLADRWYARLIEMEKKSGRSYSTARPARIRFTVYPDGSIKNISLKTSCGVPSYDKLQIEALKAIAPLPPFPAGSNKKSMTMVQGWESRALKRGERDFQPGSYGKRFPSEKLKPKAGTGKK